MRSQPENTLRILTVVGARPQFVKASMVSRAILEVNGGSDQPQIIEEIIHTGQHYDYNMSRIFFDEMLIPTPSANLEIGSGTHGEMTGRMLIGLEREIVLRKPDIVLVYGDTDSTLAGALAAAKQNVPVAHVEAGLRSFRRDMAEEINRVVSDRLSALLFCPTHTAVGNLAREGITLGVHHVGDVMYDAAIAFGDLARQKSGILKELKLEDGGYYLATIHRAENTDRIDRLSSLFEALVRISRNLPVIMPMHPRTRKVLDQHGLRALADGVRLLDPVSYIDMVRLEQGARVIMTDSGGVQKEAYFHGVPCLTLRDETEWIETVEHGWNTVVGADLERIVRGVEVAAKGSPIADYGNGQVAESVVTIIKKFLL